MARPSVLTTLADKVQPERTALLIIDMLNDFVHSDGKAAVRGDRPMEFVQSIVPDIRRLLLAARRAGVLPVHIQHSTLPEGLSDSGPWLEARMRATYSAMDVCLQGTWGQQSIDELAPELDEPVVEKHRYGGFAGTNLDLILRSADVSTVVCCGASTNVCVDATAREAFDSDYYVVIPADACGSWDRSLHDASLRTAAHRYATITTIDEVVDAWNR
jgi:nicotinamidase-related amidase